MSRSASSSIGRGEPVAEVGETLAQQALRRVDEQDARLESPEAIDQVGLLPRVLEVVAGERFVGDRVDETRAPNRQVGVDVDPRAAAAVVPVVAGPRLIRHEADLEVLARRQAEQGVGSCPEAADKPFDDGGQAIHRDLEPSVPGGESVGQRLRAGKQRLEVRCGGVEQGVVPPYRRPGEAARHVLDVGQLVAGERGGLGPERDQLGREPVATLAVVHLAG